ncbi:MAG: ATP-binding protein [Candidatus Scalindua sp.]
MHGIKRTALKSVHFLLKHFPCVGILGTRQVGKTTLLKQALPEAPFFDLEKRSDFERIQRDPDFFLSQYNQPIVIDESQILPDMFPALRVAIDAKRHKNGQFLVSGSGSPDLLRHINESLAGRIATFDLGGFSLEESWGRTISPFYRHVAEGKFKALTTLKPKMSTQQLLESCLFGGYPEPFLKHRRNEKVFSLWMENYFQSYIRRDIRNIFTGLNIQNYQRFVTMLAGASGQILNASEFARSLDVSQPTAKFYFQIAHGTFVWRMLPSYQKNTIKRIIKMPKGHMRDTGLLNHILKNQTVEQLQCHPLFGRIWETFIIETLIKGFNNSLIPVEPYFYRTSNHAEIDLILEGGGWTVPVEIKSGTVTPKKRLTNLENFVREHKLPFGLLINNAQEATLLTRNILQVPAGCL